MFYLALLLLILLGLVTLVGVIFNFGTLLGGIHLNLFFWHPNVPVLLLCLLGAFLGGLLLYVVSTFSARRDAREIRSLRAQIEELELAQTRSPSGPLAPNFPAPVVPMPGFSAPGPAAQRQGPPGLLSSRPPTGSLQNLPPSSSGIAQMPLRQGPPGPPPQAPQGGPPRPPFYQQ